MPQGGALPPPPPPPPPHGGPKESWNGGQPSSSAGGQIPRGRGHVGPAEVRQDAPRESRNGGQASPGADGPTPKGHQYQGGVGSKPETQGRPGHTSVQSSVEMPEEGPCPDLVGKYLIYYKEREQPPPPVPDKDRVLFKITAQGKEEYTHGSGRAPAGPMEAGTWNSSERARSCGRPDTVNCTREGGMLQEHLLIHSRPPGLGFCPRAPRRPCRTEGCGSHGKRPTKESGTEPCPAQVEGREPLRPGPPPCFCGSHPPARPFWLLLPCPAPIHFSYTCWDRGYAKGAKLQRRRFEFQRASKEASGIPRGVRCIYELSGPRLELGPRLSHFLARHGAVGHGRTRHSGARSRCLPGEHPRAARAARRRSPHQWKQEPWCPRCSRRTCRRPPPSYQGDHRDARRLGHLRPSRGGTRRPHVSHPRRRSRPRRQGKAPQRSPPWPWGRPTTKGKAMPDRAAPPRAQEEPPRQESASSY